jgi:hypothetical protein
VSNTWTTLPWSTKGTRPNGIIVHAKILSVEVPRNLDLLVYGLKTCGQRWSFAREYPYRICEATMNSKLYTGRLEKVLSTAMAEKRITVAQSSLPHQFYDLQYSSLDIDEALRLWAERTVPHSKDKATEMRTELNSGTRISVEI